MPVSRFNCYLANSTVNLGGVLASDSFGCTSADLDQYVTDPKDLQAIRDLEVGQRYIDKDNDLWERIP